MSLLAIVLIVILLGGLGWGWPRAGGPAYWGGGYPIGGLLGLVLVVVLILALLGRV